MFFSIPEHTSALVGFASSSVLRVRTGVSTVVGPTFFANVRANSAIMSVLSASFRWCPLANHSVLPVNAPRRRNPRINARGVNPQGAYLEQKAMTIDWYGEMQTYIPGRVPNARPAITRPFIAFTNCFVIHARSRRMPLSVTAIASQSPSTSKQSILTNSYPDTGARPRKAAMSMSWVHIECLHQTPN
jgi:hypothetical protein